MGEEKGTGGGGAQNDMNSNLGQTPCSVKRASKIAAASTLQAKIQRKQFEQIQTTSNLMTSLLRLYQRRLCLEVISKQRLHLLTMDLYQSAVAWHIEVQNGGGAEGGCGAK